MNSKYIKTKQNKKLENKFFEPFQVFYVIEKQSYKLELSTKWKLYDVFHVSLLEQDTIRKRYVNEKTLLKSEKKFEFEARNNKEYEVKAIIDSKVYNKQANN